MNPLPHPRSLACAALLTFLALTCGHSQTVPALVNYQGRLANPDGSPLPTADYTLTFNLYDAPTNGALVWGPQVFDGAVAQGHGARIPVVQGYFNVMLGPVDTNGVSLADAFNGAARCLEITVSNRPPIAPRQQILTTPFAFQAANSAKLAGYDWSALLGTNNPVTGTIPFSKLAQRPVGTNVGMGGVAISPTSGPGEYATTSYQNVTNMTVTLQTTGRPVIVLLAGVVGQVSFVQFGPGGAGGSPGNFRLLRNTQVIQDTTFGVTGIDNLQNIPPPSICFFDVPPSGTHTYTLQFRKNGGSHTLTVFQVQLVAFEL